jgi:hypothetical protein
MDSIEDNFERLCVCVFSSSDSTLSMIHWPMQRHLYKLVSSTNQINKSTNSTQVETTCNLDVSRMSMAVESQSSLSHGVTVPDDSLTNLSWLHDMNILKRAMPPMHSSVRYPANESTTKKQQDSSLVCSGASISSTSSDTVYPNDLDDVNDININNDEHWRFYRTNPQAKPVYSYSQLILLAMKQSGHEKMTLQMIYEWLIENFPYFKKMEPTWQVHLR